jgi:hypothetical protein
MKLATMDEIVFIDFEFIAEPGERPKSVCMVAAEQKSGRMFRVWLEDGAPNAPPFAIGPGVLAVSYYAVAELSCFLALGWRLPRLVLDLYAEFRVATNGLSHGRGLLDALRWYNLDGIEPTQKDRLRKRILSGGPYRAEERNAILDYCQSDVKALPELCWRMVGEDNNLTLALWRGEYVKAVTVAEHNGVPMDAPLYRQMVEYWPTLQTSVIDRVNATIPVFEGGHFRMERLKSWLQDKHLVRDWPRTLTGELAIDEDTLREVAARYPALEPLRQVRQMLGQLHTPNLSIGSDGRNRCMLSPFATKTGRNGPSSTKFIFGVPAFLRGLIRPEPGKALAYIDWEQQEFGIAAALSGDVEMQSAYASGDPYLSFAKFARAVPADATKTSHRRERNLFKETILGTQYLIGANALACKLGVTLQEAKDLLDHHHRMFLKFWDWSERVSDYGQLFGRLVAAFGWQMQISRETSIRSLCNWPMQANAAEMLRAACVFIVASRVELLTPIHDAMLIEANVSEIKHAVSLTEAAMRKASELVLDGFPLRTEAQIICPPARFVGDEHDEVMWRWLTETLAACISRAA